MKYISLTLALLLMSNFLVPMGIGNPPLELDDTKKYTEKTPLNNASVRGSFGGDMKKKLCLLALGTLAYTAGLSTIPLVEKVEQTKHSSHKGPDSPICPNGYQRRGYAHYDGWRWSCMRLHPTIEMQTNSQANETMGTVQLQYFTGAYPADCSEIATEDKAVGPWGFSLQNLTYEVERAEMQRPRPTMDFPGRVWCYWRKNPGTVVVKVGAHSFEEVKIPVDWNWKNSMIVMCTDAQVKDLEYFYQERGLPYMKLNATDTDTHMYIIGVNLGDDMIIAQWEYDPTRYYRSSWVNIIEGLAESSVSFDTLDVIGTNNVSQTISLKEQKRAAQFEKKKQQFTQPKLQKPSASRRGR